MNIDISKFYTFISSFDWNNLFSTLIGAGVGALGAYCFNLKQAEKLQKEEEKAKLMQLFYDINILSKFMYSFCTNTINLIEEICRASTPYDTPLQMDPETIDINKLGFITQKSNRMYEILVHTRLEVITIYERGIIYNESIMRGKKDSLKHLILISILYPKIMAMLFVNLYNINALLMKYYNVENLIKDNILNTMGEILYIIDKGKKQCEDLKIDKEYICMYTGEPFSEEQIEQLSKNMQDVEYILKEWLLDFGLSKKNKLEIKNAIEEKLLETIDSDNSIEDKENVEVK